MIGKTNAIAGGVDVGTIEITYTGTYTDEITDLTAGQYRLLTLTSTGELSIKKAVTADIWLCGGGSDGLTGGYGYGGAGAYCAELDNVTIKNLTCVVGARNAASSVSGDQALSVTAVNKTKNGGTGGGSAYPSSASRYAGTGDGNSKVPFGDTANFSQHCAGGGGGSYYASRSGGTDSYKGGNGGSNGANGGASSSAAGGGTISSSSGGNRGGGSGGRTTASSAYNGGNASYYGSGGGGGSYVDNEDWDSAETGSGGTGYQGIIYIRIPLTQ